MKYALIAARVIFGLVFIFSGFVKAVDPLGFSYKLDDYFLAFGLNWMTSLSLPLSILINTAEMLVGLAILLGIKMSVSAWGGLVFMVFFTPLTLYVAIFNPVSHCGCFGDAIKISNWSAFYKNIVFLSLAVFIFINRRKVKPFWSEKKDWYLLFIGGLAGILLAIYCLRNLPIIDFRPWKAGNNVLELMQGEPEVVEIFLVFENTQTGELAEYPATDYPWDDEEWNKVWVFKDQKINVIKPGRPAPIEGFMINDREANDITEELLRNQDYYFVLVSYNLLKANVRSIEKRIIPLSKDAIKNGFRFFALTSSPWSVVEEFTKQHNPDFEIFQADDRNLKTIIRSNPGLVLMKEGVVVANWAHRNIPDFETIKRKHLK